MSWIEEEVFSDGDLYFDRMIHAIESARHEVDFETYIFDRDRLGRRVLDALASAAASGVRVRLLIDGVGSSGWTWREVEEVRNRGIACRIHHPVPWQVRPRELWTSATGLRSFIARLGTLNRRLHRKSCLIDGREAFAGGMNVTARHSRRLVGGEAWRDVGVRVVGKGVATLRAAFEKAWEPRGWKRRLRQIAGLRAPGVPRGPVWSNQDHRSRRRSRRARLRMIRNATRRIWVATPYFVPASGLVTQLVRAAARGIDVRLLLPARNDVPMMRWTNRLFSAPLVAAGVRVFEYRPTVFHGKILIVDDKAVVGSSNLNHRSWLHDLEVDLVLGKPATLAQLCTEFEKDLDQSTPMTKRSLPFLLAPLEVLIRAVHRWL